MNMPRHDGLLRRSISMLADGLGMGLRIGRTAGSPLARFLHLAALRAAATGHIPVTTQFDGPVRPVPRVRLILGGHCRLGRDIFFETCEQGHIELGSHVRINRGCVVVSYAKITIGDDCLIGEYVSIRDANHGTACDQIIRSQPHVARPITIGRDVWIGRGAVILGGVTVGDGAVIGANAVVTRDVPAMTFVAGVPAKVIRPR